MSTGKKKIVAIVPLRLGSQRCPDKNLRLLDERVLPSYILETAKRSEVFDEIYVNSSAEIFRRLAAEMGVKFHLRPDHLSVPPHSHEGLLVDFLSKIDCDYIFMMHSTSPFLEPQTVRRAVELMAGGNLDTIFSSLSEQEWTFLDAKAVNFDPEGVFPPSQTLPPVTKLCWGITGWKTKSLRAAQERQEPQTFIGKIGFVPLTKVEAIDIHHEEDFQLAEMVARSRRHGGYPVKYVSW